MRGLNLSKQLSSLLAVSLIASPTWADGRAVQASNNDFRQDVAQLQRLESDYKAASSTISSISEQLQRANQELSSLQNERYTISQQIDSNVRDIRSYQLSSREMRQENIQLQNQKEKVEERLQASLREIEHLQREVQNETRKIAPIKKAYEDAQQSHTREQRENSNLSARASQLKSTIDGAARFIADKRAGISQNDKEIVEIDRRLSEAHNAVQASVTRLNQINESEKPLNARKLEIGAELRELTGRDPATRARIKALKEESARLQAQIDRNVPEKTRLNNTISKYETTKRDLERRKQTTAQETSRLVKEIETKERELALAQQEYPKAKRQKEKSDTDLAALKSQLDQAKRNYDQNSRKLNEAIRNEEKSRELARDLRLRSKEIVERIESNKRSIENTLVAIDRMERENQQLSRRADSLSTQLVRVESEVRSLSAEREQKLSLIEYAFVTTNNGKILHVIAGVGSSLSGSALNQIDSSIRLGSKVMLWLAQEPSSQLVYNLEALSGVRSVRRDYAYNVAGVGVLEGIQIQADRQRLSLDINQDSLPLMMSDNNLSFMSSKVLYQASSLQSVVITSGISPSEIGEAKLAQIIRQVNQASLVDFEDKMPSPPPVDPVPPPASGYTDLIELHDLNLAIPDNDTKGIAQELYVKADSKDIVSALELDIQIEHSYIGDLQVRLISPEGKVMVLHQNTGGRTQNLSLHLSSKDLSDFLGERAAGSWLLEIKDGASRDIGFLQAVRFKVTMN